MTETWHRITTIRPATLSAMLAVVLAAEMEAEVWLGTDITPSHRLITSVAIVFYAAPIVYRDKWPFAALVVSAAVAAIQAPFGGDIVGGLTGTLLPPLVLGYTAGARLDLRRGLIAVATAVLLLDVGVFVSSQVTQPNNYGSLEGDLIGFAGMVVACWFIGQMVRGRAQRVRAFGELSARIEREHVDRERAAVEEERARLGRELQDVIAQSLSAIIVQAGGARQLIERDPTRAHDSILAIEKAGRESLADLRRALLLLHPEDHRCELAPRPGLAQLDTLLASLRDRGVDCQCDTRGNKVPVAIGIDLLAYRFIESVLLIAGEHGSKRARVTIGYGTNQLELSVRTDTPIPWEEEKLSEIAKRAALYDGAVGGSPVDNGFSVEAHLPMMAADR